MSLRIGTFRSLPIDQRSLATWLSPADVAHLVDVSLRHPDPGCMVVNGYSNNTRLKTHDPNWATLGYKPRDNAEDYREMLRGKGVDVDAPDREEWEWPEHGGSFPARPIGRFANQWVRAEWDEMEPHAVPSHPIRAHGRSWFHRA